MKKNKSQSTALVAFCSIIFTFQVAAQAYIYPFPQGVEPSKTYKVTVDRKELFVYNAPVAPVASFDMSGPVNIEIKADRDVKWVDIRPKNLGIHPEFKDSTIRFRLEKPCNISIELNGEFSNKPLYLFANPPEKTRQQREQRECIISKPERFIHWESLKLPVVKLYISKAELWCTE